MSRGYQRLVGEALFPIVTIAGNAVISLILGSVFFDLPTSADSINSRCVLLFFAILFNGLSSALEVNDKLDYLDIWILTQRGLDSGSICPATDC